MEPLHVIPDATLMFYVLYQLDHRARAQALAGGNCQLVSDPVRVVPGMTTLTFFGHGTPTGLCEQTPDAAADLIRRWKSSNKKIKTVEILTCNSRHAPGGSDPFASKLKRSLGFRYRNLKILSMPIRMGIGGVHGDSILFADALSRTWCYMTTKDAPSFFFMRNLFKWICEAPGEPGYKDDAIKAAVYLTTPPRQLTGRLPADNPFRKHAETIADIHTSRAISAYSNQPIFMEKLALALKNAAFRREFVSTRKYSMNYGTFDQLRNQLAAVH